jgi:hypothetical protein
MLNNLLELMVPYWTKREREGGESSMVERDTLEF